MQLVPQACESVAISVAGSVIASGASRQRDFGVDSRAPENHQVIVPRSCESAVSVSFPRRFRSRPAGVVSKKAIGSRNTCAAALQYLVSAHPHASCASRMRYGMTLFRDSDRQHTSVSSLLVGGGVICEDQKPGSSTFVTSPSYSSLVAFRWPYARNTPLVNWAPSDATPSAKYTARYRCAGVAPPAASAAAVASDHTDNHQFWPICA